MRGWSAVAGLRARNGQKPPMPDLSGPAYDYSTRGPNPTNHDCLSHTDTAEPRAPPPPATGCAVGNRTVDCHNLKLTELRDDNVRQLLDNCRRVTAMNPRLHKTKSASYALRSRELNAVVLIFSHLNMNR